MLDALLMWLATLVHCSERNSQSNCSQISASIRSNAPGIIPQQLQPGHADNRYRLLPAISRYLL
ncbi:MAG UNVERIFIED_CONTAM: hypothetical protein LVR18_01725 [Planctomycetaceae bacterium]